MKSRLRDTALVAAWCAALFIVAACGGAGSRASSTPTDSLDASTDPTRSPAPSATASPPPESTGSCGSATISIDYAPYTTATLAAYAWDFVVADVVGFGPAIFNTPDGRPPPGFPDRPSIPNANGNAQTLIYTPVNVVIDRAISGPWRPGPGPGQFLVEGGTVAVHYVIGGKSIECFTMWVSPVPQVEAGSSYVFIVSEALDNGGEDPLPLHKATFAWPVDPAGIVSTPDGLMSIDDLKEIVLGATPSPEPLRS